MARIDVVELLKKDALQRRLYSLFDSAPRDPNRGWPGHLGEGFSGVSPLIDDVAQEL
jgi:hypothetical protein